jgi:hypothetical protein
MDPFEKKRFLPPIELMIVLALNAVVAILGYYAIMMWGFVRGWLTQGVKIGLDRFDMVAGGHENFPQALWFMLSVLPSDGSRPSCSSPSQS